jgi:hypothetical protein
MRHRGPLEGELIAPINNFAASELTLATIAVNRNRELIFYCVDNHIRDDFLELTDMAPPAINARDATISADE